MEKFDAAKTTKRALEISQLLTEKEMHLYRRHIEDGMDFPELVGEFGAGPFELYLQFSAIEDKLRGAFKRG
jgi:hypothetical protein